MKKTRNLGTFLLVALMAVPLIALAQTTVTPSTSGVGSINSGLNQFGGIITTLTSSVVRALSTLFATAAMVAFFYGIVQYIWGIREGDEGRVQKGNVFLRWGLVALFVMFSVWGIVTYVQRIFGIENNNSIVIPQIQLNGGTTGSPNPLQPTDGTTYWTCNGTRYNTEAAYLQACPNGGGTTNGGSQTVYTCPDGVTKYYNQTDYNLACGGGSGSGGATSCSPAGSACTKDGLNGTCGVDGVCYAGGGR